MGDVYRAEDLKLGETVALKFLASTHSLDAARLRLLYEEVRLGRQIAHPNVCRIYELLELEEFPFVVMEHVDGEDLDSLLGRIGRPAAAKALDIARDLCAGLDAIHQQQIIHGDLKPANVMLDGRGRIRITDFGLARRVENAANTRRSGGTPCYMAPEQFRDGVVSVASDIYALGLVLYETFTGKRLHDVESKTALEQVLQSSPSTISDFPPEGDPLIESLILQCLEVDPGNRPPSARALLAELPARDPIEAVIHAGEVPPPDLVLSAGSGIPRLTDRAASAILIVCVALLAAVVATSSALTLYGRYDVLKPPEVLADRARSIAMGAGAPTPADEAWWFKTDVDRLRTIAATGLADRWSRWADGSLSGVRFHYRGAAGPLLPRSPTRTISETDPPLDQPGMSHLTLSPGGRLVSLRVTPTEAGLPSSGSTAVADLLREAGVEQGSSSLPPQDWIPPIAHDERLEWQGEDGVVRVAALDGRPTWLETLSDTGADTRPIDNFELPHKIYFLILIVTLVPALLIARRNLRLGRVDRRGATSLAGWTFAAYMIHRVLLSHHSMRLEDEIQIVTSAIAASLFFMGQIWLGYVALEPYVRRIWPAVIMGWLRLLHGRLRDPLVGRELLLGIMTGLAIRLIDQVRNILPEYFLSVRSIPSELAIASLTSVRVAVGSVLQAATQAVFYGMLGAFFLIVLRVMTRRKRVASLLWLVAVTAAWIRWDDPRVDIPLVGLQILLLLILLERVGLLSFVGAVFTHLLLVRLPITFDPDLFYFSQSLLALSVLGLLLFHAARATIRASLSHSPPG